uniref:Fatty acid-binding protein homolog 2 n=1 Tax=Schistocephalus solidus TaxID=70667 RepID=A0A0V0J774_SCHSO
MIFTTAVNKLGKGVNVNSPMVFQKYRLDADIVPLADEFVDFDGSFEGISVQRASDVGGFVANLHLIHHITVHSDRGFHSTTVWRHFLEWLTQRECEFTRFERAGRLHSVLVASFRDCQCGFHGVTSLPCDKTNTQAGHNLVESLACLQLERSEEGVHDQWSDWCRQRRSEC